jgi:hypothetical protein
VQNNGEFSDDSSLEVTADFRRVMGVALIEDHRSWIDHINVVPILIAVMNPAEHFPSLAEEIRTYILSFLPWRDILNCTSVGYSFYPNELLH